MSGNDLKPGVPDEGDEGEGAGVRPEGWAPASPAVGRGEVTRLLLRWRDGDAGAMDLLMPLVYRELRKLAHSMMRREQVPDLLQTTALVHEAYLRLVGESVNWEGRQHFYAAVMRRILVDFARRRRAKKRDGGELVGLEVAAEESAADRQAADYLALDKALGELASFDPRKSRVLELRFFAGLTIAETADVMQISAATVERDYKLAKAWLGRAIGS